MNHAKLVGKVFAAGARFSFRAAAAKEGTHGRATPSFATICARKRSASRASSSS